jgi:hypothetical protein
MNKDRRDDVTAVEGVPGASRYYGCDLPQDSALTEDGWEWRSNTDAQRSRDLVDMYSEVGFEVRLEPINVDNMCSACDGCKDAFSKFNAVYIRKRP